jgi:hypothetical protein
VAASLASLEAHLVAVLPIPKAQTDPTRCGVYVLIRGDNIVYIGQSVRVDLRVAQHRTDRRIKFDRVMMLRVPPGDLDAYEGALIRSIRPRRNGAAPRPSPREQEILRSLGLPPHCVAVTGRAVFARQVASARRTRIGSSRASRVSRKVRR